MTVLIALIASTTPQQLTLEKRPMIEKSHYEKTGKLGPKIDLYLHNPRGMHYWEYQYSTRWHKTCREAKAHLCASLGYKPEQVKARIDKR